MTCVSLFTDVAPLENILVNWRSSMILFLAIRSNGDAGCGCRSVPVSCTAASRAASADVVAGMSYIYGKNPMCVQSFLLLFLVHNIDVIGIFWCSTDVPPVYSIRGP